MDVWAIRPDRVKRGQLEVLDWGAVLRDCDEGTWTMTLADDDDGVAAGMVEGTRVIAVEDGATVFSGQVLTYGGDVDDESLTISGIDDTGLLGFRIVYPDPTKTAEAQTDAAYWKKSGPAGTLLDELIYRNAGSGGIAERAFDRFYMAAEDSGVGLGSTVSANLRYQNLLEASRDLARSGGVTFWADQREDAASINVRFRTPVDRSRWVRFARGDDGGLTGGTYSLTAPTVTNVLVAGQGQGADRTIKEHTSDPGPWALRIEAFQDRRDTDDASELEQAGTDTLAEGAASASATVEVEEAPGLVYGVDYQLGDTVLVDFGRAQITEPVRSVELTGDAFGRTAKLTLGDHAAEDDNTPAWDKQVRALARRLRGLETI